MMYVGMCLRNYMCMQALCLSSQPRMCMCVCACMQPKSDYTTQNSSSEAWRANFRTSIASCPLPFARGGMPCAALSRRRERTEPKIAKAAGSEHQRNIVCIIVCMLQTLNGFRLYPPTLPPSQGSALYSYYNVYSSRLKTGPLKT